MADEIPAALTMQWIPGPARDCNHDWQFIDGERYLFAIVVRSGVDIDIVHAHMDYKFGVEFSNQYGEPYGAWGWSDVSWFLPLEPVAERLLKQEATQ